MKRQSSLYPSSSALYSAFKLGAFSIVLILLSPRLSAENYYYNVDFTSDGGTGVTGWSYFFIDTNGEIINNAVFTLSTSATVDAHLTGLTHQDGKLVIAKIQDGSRVQVAWYQLHLDGQTAPSGGFDAGGHPVDGSGTPVDGSGHPPSGPPPPKSYKKDVTVGNAAPTPQDYNIHVTLADGTTKDYSGTIPGGTTTVITLEFPQPFDYTVSHLPASALGGAGAPVDGIPTAGVTPILDASGSGVATYAAGTPNAPAGAPAPGPTPDQPSANMAPPVAPNQPREAPAGTAPLSGGTGGSTSDDLKKLNDNLGAKIDRAAEQAAKSSDQAHQDSLNEQSSIGKLAGPKGEAAPSGGGPASGFLEAYGAFPNKVALIVDDLRALATGLSIDGQRSSLNVSITLDRPYTIDIDSSQWIFDTMRVFLLTLIGVWFILNVINTTRNAYSG